jgi:predicted nucleic acid-binding Zn ribbon protein
MEIKMPIFDFKCNKCNKIEPDVLVTVNTKEEEIPVCCDEKMEKQFGITTIRMENHGIASHKHKYGSHVPDNYKFGNTGPQIWGEQRKT